MCSQHSLKVLLFTATTMLIFLHKDYAAAIPVESQALKGAATGVNQNELTDLTSAQKLTDAKKANSKEEISSDESTFSHRDEDQPRRVKTLDLDESLKYQVEVLESSDAKRENIEVEEQFRGPAIQMNTDTFAEENIEVDGGDSDDVYAIKHKNIVLTLILVIVALISIGLYVALVIWRSHLEQRYGMRELLVTEDDDFHRQNQQQSSGNSGSNGSNGLNTRHLSFGQA